MNAHAYYKETEQPEAPAKVEAKKIRFMKHYVTDGTVKARVWYSKNFNAQMEPIVTLYAKDYSRELDQIFPDMFENDTDSMTDYFQKSRVRIPASHPLYAEAMKRAN